MNKSNAKVRKFYGGDSRGRTNKRWEEKKIKLEKCATEFSRNPIPPTRRLRIDDPLPVFRIFPRQQIAFDFLKTCQQDVHVFAKEKDCNGKRSYLVVTLPEFWDIYRRQSPEERRYYEVIPEGAACRLYFDLEFKKEYNLAKDGAKMVDIFIKYVCYHLSDMFQVHCNRKLIIDFDSSTSTKFSRHLIFHMPGAVFKDNIHAGNFVRHICTLLEKKLGIGTEQHVNETMRESPETQETMREFPGTQETTREFPGTQETMRESLSTEHHVNETIRESPRIKPHVNEIMRKSPETEQHVNKTMGESLRTEQHVNETRRESPKIEQHVNETMRESPSCLNEYYQEDSCEGLSGSPVYHTPKGNDASYNRVGCHVVGEYSRTESSIVEQESCSTPEETVDRLPKDGRKEGCFEDERFSCVPLHALKELLIKDSRGNCGIFCDRGVYTKNRNFRIFRSTKIGKNAHLLPSNQNTYKPSFNKRKGSFSTDAEYLLFLDSLVSNVSMQASGKDVRVLTCESCAMRPKRSSQTRSSQESNSPSSSQVGYDHSPFPDIDEFVSRIIKMGGVQGEIRRWVFFPQGKLLTYDIFKNRWCENIGRPHKSNHIMIVVDLRLGVYYQKCHDPECKKTDYRSPERPIPDEINPLSRAQTVDFPQEYELDDDDQELCRLAAECEELAFSEKDCVVPDAQAALCVTECNNEERCLTGGNDVTECDVDWDEDDWDDDVLLELERSHTEQIEEDNKRSKCMEISQEKVQEVFLANLDCTRGKKEAFDSNLQSLPLSDYKSSKKAAVESLDVSENGKKEGKLDTCFKLHSGLKGCDVSDGCGMSGKCNNPPECILPEDQSSQGRKNEVDAINTPSDGEILGTKRYCYDNRSHIKSHPGEDGEVKTQAGFVSDRGVSCRGDEWISATDEDICEWFDEDPVSDLELSSAAEDLESNT